MLAQNPQYPLTLHDQNLGLEMCHTTPARRPFADWAVLPPLELRVCQMWEASRLLRHEEEPSLQILAGNQAAHSDLVGRVHLLPICDPVNILNTVS